jgi:hypothetical protein
MQKKIFFIGSFFVYYFFRVPTFTSVFTDKKSKRSKKDSRNQGFSSLLFFLMDGSGSRSVQKMTDPDPGGPKTYGRIHNTTDPGEPYGLDPKHHNVSNTVPP